MHVRSKRCDWLRPFGLAERPRDDVIVFVETVSDK
jgi:hypothetical protein